MRPRQVLVLWGILLAGNLVQTYRPAADPDCMPAACRFGMGRGWGSCCWEPRPPPRGATAAVAKAAAACLHLRGGASRPFSSHDAPVQVTQLATMDTEGLKHLARKAGVLDNSVQGTKNTTWLDRQYEVALKVLRRRANEAKKQKQREHLEKHGADDASIARAEQLQVGTAQPAPIAGGCVRP